MSHICWLPITDYRELELQELSGSIPDRTVKVYGMNDLFGFTPPSDCGRSNEDLECLGCGMKLACYEINGCWAEELHRRYLIEKEVRERAELARLKEKYES